MADTAISLGVDAVKAIYAVCRKAKDFRPVVEMIAERHERFAEKLSKAPPNHNQVMALKKRQQKELQQLEPFIAELGEHSRLGCVWRFRKISNSIADFCKAIDSMEKELEVVMDGVHLEIVTELRDKARNAEQKMAVMEKSQNTMLRVIDNEFQEQAASRKSTVEWHHKIEMALSGVSQLLGERLKFQNALRDEQRGATFSQSVTMIRFEMEEKQQENSPEHLKVMHMVYASFFQLQEFQAPEYATWFLSPNDVTIIECNPFRMGECVKVCRGNYDGMDVAVKQLHIDHSRDTLDQFKRELEKWTKVHHLNVVRLFGACDVATPAYFVYEYTPNGSFSEFFLVNGKATMWQLFYQASLGLRHLHRRQIVHGDLQCSNLLVGKDGLAKVGGFGFSFALEAAGQNGQRKHSPNRRKAPERFMPEVTPEARTASDIYSFGVCIWEVAANEPPYSTELHRPEGLADDEWAFVQLLLEPKWEARPKIDDVVGTLHDFSVREAATWSVSDSDGGICTTCGSATPARDRFRDY